MIVRSVCLNPFRLGEPAASVLADLSSSKPSTALLEQLAVPESQSQRVDPNHWALTDAILVFQWRQ